MKNFFVMLVTKINARKLSTSKIIALSFLAIICIGTLLLMLPVASRSGISCGFRPALFTATSATCVTGLVMYDTWTQWTGFGQTVIICLIQIGGLGFMTIASFVVMVLRKRIGMKQRMVMAQSFGIEDTGGIVKKQIWMLKACFAIEGVGALLLTLGFTRDYGFWKSLKLGVFHSISAFCNAGFDILGFREEGSSVITYGTDPYICIVLSLLIILGGLGFLVWEEVIRVKHFKKLSVYSKLVLITTVILVAGGMLLFLVLEWNNPETIGNMSFAEKLVASLFQSVTTRTAGFAGIDQGALTDASKAVTMFLMLIGGSSGSTAGGLKTVTFIVIVLFMLAQLRGKKRICVFNRNIPDSQVVNALTIFGIMVGLSFIGSVVISATSPISFTDGLYEAISALATVGLTTGVTSSLSVVSQFMIIIFMYFGRVGVLTLSLGFLMGRGHEPDFSYAETNVLIG